MNPFTVDYLTNLSVKLTAQVLPFLRRHGQIVLAGDEASQAIERCLHKGIVALVTQSSFASLDHELLLADIFVGFFANPDVAKEITRLLRGQEWDRSDLALFFVEVGYDAAVLPGLDFNQGLDTFAAAFLVAAASEPILQGKLQTHQLLAHTRLEKALIAQMQQIVDQLDNVGPVDIHAGKIRATNVVSGTQIIYQWPTKIDNTHGIVARGAASQAIGERGILVDGDVGGDVISGNLVQHILHLYSSAPGQPHHDEAVFKQSLGRYLGWVERNYGRLNLRGLLQKERQNPSLTLDDVYVSLEAQIAVNHGRQGKQASNEPRPEFLSMSQLLNLSKRLAIIGGPGSGKTTFLRLIATALAHALRTGDTAAVQANLGLTGDLPLPIIVALSEFNAYRRQYNIPDDPHQGTLTTFLSYTLIRQHNIDLPGDFFERLLRRGQGCILLLDGLDEIANERERWLVRQAVEELSNNEGILQIIVTSRTRAFQGRTILDTFRRADVRPMTRVQVNALIGRWCRAVYHPTAAAGEAHDMQQAIANLEALRQLRGDSQLVNTPLLTTIVAIVHYDQRRLPQQRATLYEKCIEVLLAERHKPDRPTYYDLADFGGTWADKRNWLACLAYQKMSAGEKTEQTISEAQLLNWLQPVLVSRFGDDEGPRRLEAFVQAMRERGSLLHEIDGAYKFSHLTFQEYLTAYYLAETIRQVDKIVDFLQYKNRLSQSWWRETVLLIAGHLESKSATAVLDFIAGLVVHTKDNMLGLAAAELAATALLELDSQDTSVLTRVRSQLIRRLIQKDFIAKHSLQALAGRTLARLGDMRSGVGTIILGQVKIPDIQWGEMVPSAVYTILGDESAYVSKKKEIWIEKAYHLACYPVTYAQFDCFVQADDFNDDRWWDSMFSEEQTADNRDQLKELSIQAFPYDNHPRERVSWYQAIAFCRWLSEKVGYEVDLPNEYEWAVAARYPHQEVYPWGDKFSSDRANTSEAKINITTAVGIYLRGVNSALGLYDLCGNVWEWCRNKYEDPEDTSVDSSDDWRVLRGGSWASSSLDAPTTIRGYEHPDSRLYDMGFRLVRRL